MLSGSNVTAGVVSVIASPTGKTVGHAGTQQTITLSGQQVDNPGSDTTLTAVASVVAGTIHAFAKPSEPCSYGINVVSSNSNTQQQPGYIPLQCDVWFTHQPEADYNVTFTNNSLTSVWKGFIHLHTGSSSGVAHHTLRVTNFHQDPAHPNNDANWTTLPDVTWLLPVQYGPVLYPWDLNADATINVSSEAYAVTTDSAGEGSANCHVGLRVILHHTVACEQANPTLTYKSQTDEWKVLNWSISVQIEKP